MDYEGLCKVPYSYLVCGILVRETLTLTPRLALSHRGNYGKLREREIYMYFSLFPFPFVFPEKGKKGEICLLPSLYISQIPCSSQIEISMLTVEIQTSSDDQSDTDKDQLENEERQIAKMV